MERTSFNIGELGLKARTKYEIYRLLTVEGQFYLPPVAETSIEFIGEIVRGEKSVNIQF